MDPLKFVAYCAHKTDGPIKCKEYVYLYVFWQRHNVMFHANPFLSGFGF
jgi:hypothetical protein